MAQLTIEVKGLKELKKSFDNYVVKIPKGGRRGVWLFANKVAKRLREAAPKGASGYMKSKKGTHVKKVDKDEWNIVMPWYTKVVEGGIKPSGKYGSAPHWIPRRAKTTAWAKKAGMSFEVMRTIIASKGTKPHPFTEMVIQATLNDLAPTVDKEIRRAIKQSKR